MAEWLWLMGNLPIYIYDTYSLVSRGQRSTVRGTVAPVDEVVGLGCDLCSLHRGAQSNGLGNHSFGTLGLGNERPNKRCQADQFMNE